MMRLWLHRHRPSSRLLNMSPNSPKFAFTTKTSPREMKSKRSRRKLLKTHQEQLQQILSTLPQTIKMKELTEIMRKSQSVNVSLSPYYSVLQQRSLSCIDPEEIGSALFGLLLTKKYSCSEDFSFLLSTLAMGLGKIPNDSISTVESVKALASLDRIPQSKPVVQQFFGALKPKINHIINNCGLISSQEVTIVLETLRHCKDPWIASQILHVLLSSIGITNIQSYQQKSLFQPELDAPDMTGKEMSRLLFNLQCINSFRPETRMLLDYITGWIRKSPHSMTPYEWSLALCGLSKMNSQYVEVTNLLLAIADKMECEERPSLYNCHEEDHDSPQNGFTKGSVRPHSRSFILSPRQLSQAMYGLRFMDSKHDAVMLIIRKITTAIVVHFSGKFEGMDLARVLYGLKSMSSQDDCVRKLCQVLAEKMDRDNIRISTLQNIDLTMACRGFEKLSSEREEVRQLVKVLAEAWSLRRISADPRVSILNEAPFTGQMISQALFGLQLMDNCHEEVEMLLFELAWTMNKGRRNDNDFTPETNETLGNEVGKSLTTYQARLPSTDSLNMQELCNAIYGLRSMRNSAPFSPLSSRQFRRDPNELIEELIGDIETIPKGDKSNYIVSNEKHHVLEKLLKSILDRTTKIQEALSMLTTNKVQRCCEERNSAVQWISIEPMHMAHALYGLQHLGTDHYKILQGDQKATVVPLFTHDYAADIVELLSNVKTALAREAKKEKLDDSFAHDAISTHESGDNSLIIDDGNWTPYLLHDCLYGLLSVDVLSNKSSLQLLQFLLNKCFDVIQCEKLKPLNRSDDSVLKLYHTLLFYEGKALQSHQRYDPYSSPVPQQLYSQLLSVISATEGCLNLQQLQEQKGLTINSYKKQLQEIIESLDNPAEFNSKGHSYRMSEDQRPRKIKAFYNTYLHGFHSDIVLVGYYDSKNEGEMMMSEGAYQHTEKDLNNYYNYIGNSAGALRVEGSSSSTSFESFIQNCPSRKNLVVVNVEIDGHHKNIVGNYCRDKHRDNFLKNKFNIAVHRVNVTEPHKDSQVLRLGSIVDFILDLD